MSRSTPSPTFFRRLLRPLPILGVLLTLAVAAWYVFGPAGVLSSYRLYQQKQAQAAHIRQLEAKRQELSDYYAALKAQDVAALERAAREHGLVAPGEMIYEIKIDEPKR
jgi:cell division protein FtsB